MFFTFLIVMGAFLFLAGIFCLRYFIGEQFFWGRKYIKKGFRPLLSQRVNGYILDTMGICFLTLYAAAIFVLIRSDQLPVWGTWDWISKVLVILLSSFVLFSMSFALQRIFACYNEQGLFISKPFSRMHKIPWEQIKEIRPNQISFEVLSCEDKVLIRFSLTKKNVSFLDYAQLRGVSVKCAKAESMFCHSDTKNALRQEWKNAIAHSPYAKNQISAYGEFQDFIVVLFMDKKLKENNVIAINADGSTRWTISEILTEPKSVPYVAMAVESPETISVLSVLDQQYHGVLSTINVYTRQVMCQIDRREI